MRKTFERAGFVKEAHLRNAWFSPKENSYYDAMTYGITREDFLAEQQHQSFGKTRFRARNRRIRRIPSVPQNLNRSASSFGS